MTVSNESYEFKVRNEISKILCGFQIILISVASHFLKKFWQSQIRDNAQIMRIKVRIYFELIFLFTNDKISNKKERFSFGEETKT